MYAVELDKSSLVTKYLLFSLLPSLDISPRRKLLASFVALNKSSFKSSFPRAWQVPVERGPPTCPGAAPCPGPSWSFSSDRNSPRATNPPSLLLGSAHSSKFSTPKNQTLDTSCASKQSVEDITSPSTTALSSSKVNGAEEASLSLHPEVTLNGLWCEHPGVRNNEIHPLLQRPLASTAPKGQSKAPIGIPAENTSGINGADFDLDPFDIDDFEEGWEDVVDVSAPERQSTPLYQPIREGPPAKSLLSKIMSKAKGSAVVSNPAASKSSSLMTTKNCSGRLCVLG